jgi:hypothetical protein
LIEYLFLCNIVGPGPNAGMSSPMGPPNQQPHPGMMYSSLLVQKKLCVLPGLIVASTVVKQIVPLAVHANKQ